MQYLNQQNHRYEDMIRFAQDQQRAQELITNEEATGFYALVSTSISKLFSTANEQPKAENMTATLEMYQLETA